MKSVSAAVFITLLVASLAPLIAAPPEANAFGQSPALTGRWVIEFTLRSRAYAVEFDAEASGGGTLVVLDAQTSRAPRPASWRLTGQSPAINLFLISGAIDLPTGDGGAETGTIEFSASAEPREPVTSLSGWGQYHPPGAGDGRGGNDPSFSFTARRVNLPTLRLVSPAPKQRARRGGELNIEWEMDRAVQVSHQSLWLSTDNRATFVPLSPPLDGDTRNFLWQVPKRMPKAKKAFIKIVAVRDDGLLLEAINESPFLIK